MTDPLDLEALKERAHNYRFERDSEFVVTVLADLDRAIEIAEQVLNSEGFGRAVEKKAMSYHESACVYQRERDQARQDVLRLRHELELVIAFGYDPPMVTELVEATAHYEQHRQAQEGGGPT